MNKHLHIVCFDAPAPPDYGGAIDLYFKIVALAKEGIQIILHYFNYREGRNHAGLEPYCKAIFSYERKSAFQSLRSPLPYIVYSRINNQLVQRLNADDHPILLEGVHCTGLLSRINLKNRKVVVRLHNNEAAYYQRLASTETAPLRNFYYLMESNRLVRYQRLLPTEVAYTAISEIDAQVFQNQYGLHNTSFLPCFVPWQQITSAEGLGTFCLYHGNLSVSENRVAVLWLLKHVFAGTDLQFVIAGKGASKNLDAAIAKLPNAKLVNNPTDDELELLIRNAQVHVLPSLNETGVKLKLLHALFCGRHCVTNMAGVAGSGLENLVHLAEDAGIIQQMLRQLMQQPFTQKEMQQRQSLLHQYNNTRNAGLLNSLIY